MPEIALTRSRRFPACNKVPSEMFSLKQIPAEFASGATLLILSSIKSVKEQFL
jgi:hypothetical protein